jgi:hypothetical protein
MPRQMTINEKQYQVMDAQEAGIVAGMTLDEAAARVLFQVRSENVGNNLRAKVKAAEAGGKSPDEIAQMVAEYDQKYTFSMPGTGTGRKTVDPLEREARALAIDWIKEQLSERGRKYTDVKKEKPEVLEERIAQAAQSDQIVKLAKRRLAEKRKAGAEVLELATDL